MDGWIIALHHCLIPPLFGFLGPNERKQDVESGRHHVGTRMEMNKVDMLSNGKLSCICVGVMKMY